MEELKNEMNKIRVIDLLNKIANGEDVPEKIKNKYVGIMKWNERMKDYQAETSSYWLFFNDCEEPTTRHLNDTVEIIEEQQDIETLNPEEVYFKDGTELVYKLMYDKINEIAMRLNKINKNIKDKEK